MTKPDMSVEIAGMRLRNPVMTASGTFGYGEEFAAYVNLEEIGAIITKGLSLKPRAGNPTPRIVETPGGMLNAIGLQNVGIDAFIAKKAPYLRTIATPVIVNLFGNTLEEYGELAARLDRVPEVAGVEVNISCPNVKHGGIVFGTDPQAAYDVVKLVRESTIKPVIVKLSPNVTDVVEMAHACVDAGADALSLINTLTGMAIDLQKRRPVLANVTGGLSGPAIKPVALRMVWQVAKAVDSPDHRHRRHHVRNRCPGVHAGRGNGGPGRHGEFSRPRGGPDHRPRHGTLPGGQRHRRGEEPDRRSRGLINHGTLAEKPCRQHRQPGAVCRAF